MAEIDRDDIPVLSKMLGDERGFLLTLAGSILTELGEDGLASLKLAAKSPDHVIRDTAKSALMDFEIIKGNAQQPE